MDTRPATPAEPSRPWRERVGCWSANLTLRKATGIAVGIAAACTVPTVGRQSLSWDEATTLRAARLPFGQLALLLRHTDAPLGLYYALMHCWLSVLGGIGIPVDEATLRLPSVAAALGSVVLLVRLAHEWFGPRVAVSSGCLLAVHPMVTFYAQDARPYTMVMFTFLASTAVLRRAITRPERAWFILYSVLVALTLYLHLFAIFAVLAHGVLVRRRGDRRPLVDWLVAVAVAVAATTPLLLTMRSQSGAIGWIPSPTVTGVASVLAHLVGGVGFVVVFLAAALFMLRRRAYPQPPAFVWAWVVFPPLALVAADFVTPDLVARYGLVMVPALVLVVALVVRTSSRAGAVLVTLGIATALVATVVQQTAPFKYEDYRSASDFVGDSARPGAAIVFLPVSMRDGYLPYENKDDAVKVSDPLLASPAVQARDPQLGGDERSVAQATASLRHASEIFLFGYTLAEAEHALTSPADVAKLRLLSRYRVLRVAHYGDVWVSVLG